MPLPARSMQDDGFVHDSTAFMQWLKQSPGVRVSPKIDIADLRSHGAGRGVVATQSIAEDEELFAIPLNLVLNVKNSKASELLALDEEDLDPWLSLIVVMIYEFLQGGASLWAPYFRVLPTTFDTLMFWTDDELRELQGSAVIDKIGKKDADSTFTERVLPLVINHPDLFPPINGLPSFNSPEGRQFLLSLAHRMGSLIMAYAFDIEKEEPEDMSVDGQDGYVTDEEDEGEDVPKGMVPLADTLNADADRNNARLFQEDDFFIMKAIKPIAAGEEIFNDYGELPRVDLLRRYGYVTDNYAKYDVVEFSLGKLCAFAGLESADPGPNTPQLEYLEDALESWYSIPRFPAETPVMEALPESFLVSFRVLRLSKDEVARLRATRKLPKDPVSGAEANALIELISQRLRDYPTTLEEDAVLLRDLQNQDSANTSHRRRTMAIQVRQGEKEILKQLIDLLQSYASQTAPDNKRVGSDLGKDKGSKRRKQ